MKRDAMNNNHGDPLAARRQLCRPHSQPLRWRGGVAGGDVINCIFIRKCNFPKCTFEKNALKGQRAHSPGQSKAAPWVCMQWKRERPERAKAQLHQRITLLPFQGDLTRPHPPRVLPWAKCFWAFSPFAQSYRMQLFLEK